MWYAREETSECLTVSQMNGKLSDSTAYRCCCFWNGIYWIGIPLSTGADCCGGAHEQQRTYMFETEPAVSSISV
jgi:hypothetical protein